MGELMGMQGGKPEVDQGLGKEACQRWLGGAQGEATVVPAVQQAVMDGLSKTNLARYPVMHLQEWRSQMEDNLSIEELPQGETEAVADDSGSETTEGSESQLEKRIGVLEWGLAARVQRAAESMSEIRFQREAEESRSAAVKEQVSRLEQEGCVVVALVKQVEVRQAELETKAQVKRVELLKQVDERLREVQERPDMTERIESIEKSMQVCVNSVRVLHSYAEANGSSDSDRDDT